VFTISKCGFYIALSAMEYAPGLRRFSSSFKDAMEEGGARAQEMHGKAAFGGVLGAGIGLYALAGNVTGRGPKNYKSKQIWKEAGNQEYSLKIGDTWISYNRLGAFGRYMAFCADLATAGFDTFNHETDEFTDVDGNQIKDTPRIQEFLSLAATMATEMVEPEYFVQSMGNLVEAIESKDPSRLLNNIIPNTVPLTGPMKLITSNMVPTYRDTTADPESPWLEIEGILNRIVANSPWYSKDLPPKLNIFGEEVGLPAGYFDRVNPFYSSQTSVTDPVMAELTRLNYFGVVRQNDADEG
jgi:hypothetical protein